MFKVIFRFISKPERKRPDRMRLIRETEQDLNVNLARIHQARTSFICRERIRRSNAAANERSAYRLPDDKKDKLGWAVKTNKK